MVTQQKAWGLMVAATVALTGLTGCQNASPVGAPFAGEAAGQDATAALASSMLDEQDVADFDYMIQAARGARYSVAQADEAAEAPKGKGLSDENKQRLEERFEALRTAVAARLAAKAETADKVKKAHDEAPETTDEEGKKAKNFSFEDGRNRTVESEVKSGPDGSVVYSRHVVVQKGNGGSRELSRIREEKQDGTVHVTYHRERTFNDGRVNTADWTKTISPDGGVTGSGTITIEKKDGTTKTIELNFGGTVEQTTGLGQNEDAEVTVPPNGKAYGKGGKPAAEEGEDD